MKNKITILFCFIFLYGFSQSIDYKLIFVDTITINDPILCIQKDSTTKKSLSVIVPRNKQSQNMKLDFSQEYFYYSDCKLYKAIQDIKYNNGNILGYLKFKKIIDKIEKSCNSDNYGLIGNEAKTNLIGKCFNIKTNVFLLCFVSANYYVNHLSIDDDIEKIEKKGYLPILIPLNRH